MVLFARLSAGFRREYDLAFFWLSYVWTEVSESHCMCNSQSKIAMAK